MEQPIPCTSCNGRSTIMAHDGVFYFLVCEKCQKIGPSADSEDAAIEMWNGSGESLFFYGAIPKGTKIMRRIECSERRDSERQRVALPFIMSVGEMLGPLVKGKVRNLSMYGAYLELTGGELSSIPMDDKKLPVMYLRLPDVMSIDPAAKDSAMPFQPVRVEWTRHAITMGGRFVAQREEHRAFVQQVLDKQAKTESRQKARE